jgi:hypothetical protein
MRLLSMFIIIACFILLFSSQRKLYYSYPGCTAYFDYIKKHWKQKESGVYFIEETIDSSDWTVYIKPPEFVEKWNEYRIKCLTQLTPAEVVQLFGKPTEVGQFFNQVN